MSSSHGHHIGPAVKKGILVRLEAKPGKESEVERFLYSGLGLVEQEPLTTTWFAIKFGPSSFGIYDALESEEGRQDHLKGEVAKALFAQAEQLFSKPPAIEQVDILASKFPK